MRGFYVYLPPAALDALDDLAAREWRSPRDQAAVLLLAALRAAGVLNEENEEAETATEREAAGVAA